MMNTTIKDAVMEIVSVDLDGESFQSQILSCLQMLRENETERAKFSDSVCFEAVSACSSVGGQERVQFILLNALQIEYQTMVKERQELKNPSNQMKNLTKSICKLNLNSSLQSGSDEMNLRAFTFLRNPIESDHQFGRTIVESLLSVARLPHTNESYGLYISALLLAIGVYQILPSPPVNEMAQKWMSDYEDEQTAFRRDLIDLFGRRVFALGGSAKPATAVHINLSSSIIATLSEEEFNKSIVGPIKFKLMNAPHDLMETIGAFINSLIQRGKGMFIQPHLSAGTNLIGSCTKQVINSDISKVRDDASYALSTMITACPEQATNDILNALITPLSTEQNPHIERILMCLERLGNTISTLKNNNNDSNNRFWELPSNNVITALRNLDTTEKRSALECWLTLAGREDEMDHSSESSSSSDLIDFGHIPKSKPAVSSLDKDLQAKRNAAASSFTSMKPGAHNVNSAELDRKIAAKSNIRSNVSNYESQLAAKTKANTWVGHRSGEFSNISDLDDRINRKAMQSQSDKKKESPYSQVTSQSTSMQPALEVKQTTADHICSSDDVENNILVDEEKKSNSSRDNDDLAVAVAVDPENEENPFLPAALKYDPDAKPKLYQNKRFRCAAVISILILIAMSVGIGVGVSRNVSETIKEDPIKEELFVTAAPTRTPTTSPTTFLKKLSIQKLIEISHMVSPDIQYNSSIHNKVLNWMGEDQIVKDIYYNSEGSIYEHPRFIERYTSACLYFSLSGNPPTMSNCRQFDEYVNEDANITHCNFTDQNGDTSVRARWMSSFDVCDWGGISCTDLHLNETVNSVHEINLHGMGLMGFIPPEIGLLTDMRNLYISDNLIKGIIPRQIGELKQLEIFEGQSNELIGSLPIELYDLTNLRQLNLAGNKLQGQFDPEIKNLSYLIGLHLFSNKFSGPIPSEIGQLRSLQEITFSQNSFNSTIPSELGSLNQLIRLHLSNNPILSGSIPSEIGNLRRLRMLVLDGCSLSDSIPDTIYNLTRLEYFMVSKNKLSGQISPKISKLKSLQVLWLKENFFNGIIPSEIGSLMKLERVGIYRNDFKGDVANEICSLFTNGQLQEFSADCSPTNKEDAEVSCWCCTTCCEPGEKGICHNT